MSSHSSMVYYVLGFTPAVHHQTPVIVPPILEQLRIECLRSAEIACWCRQVSRNEFDGPQAQANLADLHWLTPRVLAHESVVSLLNETYPLYPARFGCLFSSRDALVQFTLSQRQVLLDFFASAASRQEWGVKFTVDLDEAARRAAIEALAAQGVRSSGANYLMLKQKQRKLREPVFTELQKLCNSRIDALRDAFEHVHLRSQRHQPGTDREVVLANVALWLTAEQVERLAALQQTWLPATDGNGIQVCVTGPWPAYSFCPSLGEAAPSQQAA